MASTVGETVGNLAHARRRDRVERVASDEQPAANRYSAVAAGGCAVDARATGVVAGWRVADPGAEPSESAGSDERAGDGVSEAHERQRTIVEGDLAIQIGSQRLRQSLRVDARHVDGRHQVRAVVADLGRIGPRIVVHRSNGLVKPVLLAAEPRELARVSRLERTDISLCVLVCV